MIQRKILHNSIQNIILISFDSLRSDYIENLKDDFAPTFQLMRDKGVFFKNAIVQAPFTIPSHFSMLTGLYPAKTGVRDMHHQLPADVPSIFEILQKEGILTFSFASTPMLKSRKIKGIDKELRLTAKKFTQTINQFRDKQFFAFLHSWDTHTPYNTWLPFKKPIDLLLNFLKLFKVFKCLPGGERYTDLVDLRIIERIRALVKTGDPLIFNAIRKGYLSSIGIADQFLNKLLKTVQKTGILEKTLFIIMGDHGDSFNEHDEIHRQSDARYEHGHFLYDNILRIPLIFYSPYTVIKKIYEEQVQLIDIVPTIFEAYGITYNGNLDGVSLWRELTHPNSVPERKYAFSEVIRESRGIELRCIRSNTTKLIIDYKSNNYELYNLSDDPEEQNNIWPNDSHDEKNAMLKELFQFSKIATTESHKSTDADQKQIENVLKSLGYM